MKERYLLQKTLTANDVGETGSHQAGIHVPDALASFFPALPEDLLNPDAWLEVEDELGIRHPWRWIHYNNRVVGSGTRDEYRLTHTSSYLGAAGAREGDILELEVAGAHRYRASIRSKPQSGVLVLSTAGAWRTIATGR